MIKMGIMDFVMDLVDAVLPDWITGMGGVVPDLIYTSFVRVVDVFHNMANWTLTWFIESTIDIQELLIDLLV